MVKKVAPTAVLCLLLGLFLISWPIHVQSKPDETCEFNGTIFRRGESLGAHFVTRCGPAADYPCFCNPDLIQQFECPYCGFELEGGDLLCGKDLEIHNFTDICGFSKTCECSAPLGGLSPSVDCEMYIDESSGHDVGASCAFNLSDGTSVSFQKGDRISAILDIGCSNDFPCYCDPTAEDQVFCPYCHFPAMGGGKFCALDGQAVAFKDEDGVIQNCSCTINLDGEPFSTCNLTGNDNGPFLNNENHSSGIDRLDRCTLEIKDSNKIITFRNGQSYGEYLSSRCGSASEFPCFCNTALPNQIDCPYCSFVTGNGELFCASNNETVGFADGDIYRTCTCEIVAPGKAPIGTCQDGETPSTTAPTATVSTTTPSIDVNTCIANGHNGEVVVVLEGESFGGLISPGVCGSTEEWPFVCSVGLAHDAVSRQGGERKNAMAEYPYCIFRNTQSGTPVCAKKGERVTFTDDLGVTQRCSCSYVTPSSATAQPSCIAEVEDSPSPTFSPVLTVAASSSAVPRIHDGVLAVTIILLGVTLAFTL